VNGHRNIEPDQRHVGIWILHAETGNDQTKEQQGIDQMPDPDP
jgi:hypothetical protein